jgi:hypothetical protein
MIASIPLALSASMMVWNIKSKVFINGIATIGAGLKIKGWGE